MNPPRDTSSIRRTFNPSFRDPLARLAIALASLLTAAIAAPAATPASLIDNGSMTEGDATPTGWALGSYKVGKLSLARDAVDFKSAPASLKVTTDGKATGFAIHRLAQTPPGPITLHGWAKSEGTFKSVQVAVQAFDAQWKQVDWKTLVMVKAGAGWQQFDATITLPAGASSAVAGLLVDGEGQAWLDDLTVTSAEAAAEVSPAFPMDQALPVAVAPEAKELRRVGRFDASEPAALRFAWPASSIAVRFNGTAINLKLDDNGGNRFAIFLDDKPALVLKPARGPHLYRLADALPPGEHTITLVKRTESFAGVASFGGFQLSEGGKLVALPASERRIEVIGDSISAGYGNEAANQNVRFSAETENACEAYGSLAARAFGADYVCIAWSGKKLWPDNAIPDLYDRTLPEKRDSKWDFTAGPPPQVVLINLGTNDFGPGNPEEEGWVKAYHVFLDRIRHNYPEARIYLAIGTMMSDPFSKSKNALTTVRRYITRVVDERAKAGDQRVSLLEFGVQDGGKNGFGADWHPSLKTHRLMAEKLIDAIHRDMGWERTDGTHAKNP